MKLNIKIAGILITFTLLSGCVNSDGTTLIVDQCLRQQLFTSCMKLLPAGPVVTHYNDWDEVVTACDNSSYYQSIRQEKFVKPECKGNS